MSDRKQTLEGLSALTGNPGMTKQSDRLVNMAVEEVFHDWITRNMGLNYETVVADLLNHGLIDLIQDENDHTVGFKKGRLLTEDQQYRVADGITKCIAYVLDESNTTRGA